MFTILIVDDHPLMREGLALILDTQHDWEVSSMVGSAEEALALLPKQSFDLLVVDISLPNMSGLEFIKQVKSLYPQQKTLVISRHDEQLYAERAIRAGAKGYVMKVEARKVIIEAIRKVLEGGIYISDAINERLLQSMINGKKSMTQSPLEVLSDRELEIFEMVGRGIKSSEIAERLFISAKTVESYRTRIKDKLNLHSSAELMQHAVQWVESVKM
jgi:DNA-binding NarL/FixJ family response regulator